MPRARRSVASESTVCGAAWSMAATLCGRGVTGLRNFRLLRSEVRDLTAQLCGQAGQGRDDGVVALDAGLARLRGDRDRVDVGGDAGRAGRRLVHVAVH